jgi:hypothetical protein
MRGGVIHPKAAGASCRCATPDLFHETAVVLLLSACLLAACNPAPCRVPLVGEGSGADAEKGLRLPYPQQAFPGSSASTSCASTEEWKNRQQQRKFKGYKNDRPVKKTIKSPIFRTSRDAIHRVSPPF